MRGQTFSSYVLAAFALTAHAAPLLARYGEIIPAGGFPVRGLDTGKVGVVAVGQEFERRKASATSKAAAGAAKASAPADLPAW